MTTAEDGYAEDPGIRDRWAQTHSGGYVHAGGHGEFTIEDVFRGVAVTPRFAGQTNWTLHPYTVGQHSLNVANVVLTRYGDPVLGLAGLMHDGAEGLLGGDFVKPFKSICPDYEALEDRIQRAVYRAAGLPEVKPPQVHMVDSLILWDEGTALMPHNREGWRNRYAPGVERPIDLAERPPGDVLAELLETYERLWAWVDRRKNLCRTLSAT